MNSFWMIWSPQGQAPTVRHDTPESARAEAERLARANRGSEFYVLEAVSKCTKIDVVWTTLGDHNPGEFKTDDIPF